MAKTKAKATGAVELLKEQHDKVKKAFKEFEKLDREDTEKQQQLVQSVCEDLKLHTTLEEELFYPAAREAMKEEDLIEEAEVEHGSAKALMQQLEGMSPEDPKFFATFRVLGEYLKHHIKEEENELFEQLGSGRSKVRWEELQQQMRTMRETLMAEMGLGAEEGEEQEQPRPATRARSGGRSRSEQSADQEETVE